MFGKRARKANEESLKKERDAASASLTEALNKPRTALDLAKEKEQTDWYSQTSDPNFDITKTTGMIPHLNLYNRAKANDQSDDTPMPTAASWGGTPNLNLAEALKSQGARSREQEAAGGLEEAFRSKDASIRGETLPYLGMQQDKNLNLMNMLNNRSMGMSSLYGRSLEQMPFWQRYLLGQQQNAQAFAAGAGG